MSHTPVKSNDSEVIAPVFHASIGRRVLQSSVLQFGGRFLFRGLKFIRTIVVAQLLFPHDVGLFALASLCLGFADVFVQTGFQSAIVEKDGLERRHLDGAWTVHVLKGFLLGGIAFLLAPHLALFFNEPRLTEVLRVLSVMLALDGFVNVGAVLLQKDLQFGKKLLYDFSYIATEIVGVIIAAQFIQSVWALVIGTIAGQIASVVFSYIFHQYRPRFTLNFSGARELFIFGKWMSITGILTFFVSKGDGIAISKVIGVEELGYYQLAFSLALIPSYEIVRSLGSVFFPFFARLKAKPNELRDSFVRISRMVLLIVVPATVGLYVVSGVVVTILYGERWLPLIPILHILIVYGGFKSIEYLLTPILLGAGHPKIITYATGVYGTMLAITIVPLTSRYGVEGTAWSLVIGACVATIYLMIRFHCTVVLTGRQVLSIILVPVGASIMMYLGIAFLKQYIAGSIPLFILAGVVVYTVSIFILDNCTGYHVRTSFVWMRQNVLRS